MNPLRATNASAGGSFLSVGSGLGYLAGASLRAAAANATATIRDGGAGGPIIAILAAPANSADHDYTSSPIVYTGSIHVTIVGAGAELIVYGA